MPKHLRLNSAFLAKVISGISNPFLLFTFAILIGDSEYIFVNPGELLAFTIISLFVPLVFYIYELLKHKTHILHYVSLDRKSRTPIYFVAIYSAFFNIIVFSYLHLSFWVFQGILIFVLFSLMYLVNRYIDKVSMHAAAYGFTVFYLIDKSSTAFIFFLLFLPLIFWARYKLHKHTKFQLYLGAMIGISIGLLSWLR